MQVYIEQVDFGTPECDDILRLRYDILRKPLNMEFEVNDIAEEYTDIHLGCYHAHHQQLLGCLLLRPVDNHTMKMRQVAVDEDYQGAGIGKMLVDYSEKLCKAHEIQQIKLHARMNAVPFYEKMGYLKKGKLFKEVGIDHYLMYKNL